MSWHSRESLLGMRILKIHDRELCLFQHLDGEPINAVHIWPSHQVTALYLQHNVQSAAKTVSCIRSVFAPEWPHEARAESRLASLLLRPLCRDNVTRAGIACGECKCGFCH